MIPLQDSGSGSNKFPFWVIVIIAVNIFVFYLELSTPNIDAFITQYALIPAALNFSQIQTLKSLITSQFLHGGFLHIISNMWFLWIFGDNVESRFSFAFPIFYLISGIIGALLQYLTAPTSTVPNLGASGAIAGVLGAYYALYPNNKVKTLIFILFFITIVDIPAAFMLFYWLIIQLFSSAAAISTAQSSTGGIAYFAHIGGFAFGWLLGKLLSLQKAPFRSSR